MEQGDLSYGCVATIRFLITFKPNFLISDVKIGARIEQHNQQRSAGKSAPIQLITKRKKVQSLLFDFHQDGSKLRTNQINSLYVLVREVQEIGEE